MPSRHKHQEVPKAQHTSNNASLSKCRDRYLYTSKRIQSQKRELIDIASSDDSEKENVSEMPTPVSLRKTQHHNATGVCKQRIILPPPPRPQSDGKSMTQSANAVESEESCDELANSPLKQLQVVKRGRKRNLVLDLLEELKRNKLTLSAFMESGELEAQDPATIQQLKEQCSDMDKIFNPPATVNGADVPSTSSHYDQLFMYLAKSNLIYLVQPVHVFGGNKYYSRKKTFGLVRIDKNSEPLMCTISGDKNCADLHPKLLDVELWTEEVKHWAKEHGHTFRNGMYDKLHGKSPGHYHAAHVEPRLMLWYACYVVNQRLGLNKPEREQIAHIWRLNKLKDITAEIMISHSNKKPCGPCMAFQKDIEDYTGIKYYIISCPNLGELQMVRSKHGNNEVPLYAMDSEQEGSEDGEELPARVPVATSSEVAVTIRSKTTTTTSLVVAEAPFQDQAVQRAEEMRAKARSMRARKKRRHAYVDSEEEEATPFVTSSKKKSRHGRH